MSGDRTRACVAGWLAAALIAALSAVGCRGSGAAPDAGGDGTLFTGGDGSSSDRHPMADHAGDQSTSGDGGCLRRDGGAAKAIGQPCGCNADCAGNFCVDGFCCNEACGGGCRTCALTGSEGTCVARSAGSDPRAASDCALSTVSSCGLDGKCDGAGACRKHVAGTICKGGTCEGSAVKGALVCDGDGHCRPGPTMICAPFTCDPSTGDCYKKCTSPSQCVEGQACDASGSCGKRLNGGPCATGADCWSGFCANKVCCNVACQGPCVSCVLPSREGMCWPIEPGVADPNGVCQDKGVASCGTNGKCDGVGGCSRYPVDTLCVSPVCAGNRLNTAASCDGLGTCRAPGLTNCSPFLCTADACTVACDRDDQCDQGIACVNHTCGPKQNGQSCGKASECKSGHCVDGVCCDGACTGACRSCALPSSPGKCTMVGSGNADPRAVCKDAGAPSCGQTGKCDGAGGCQLYSNTTTCMPETCSANVYTPASTCDGAGRCVMPASRPCAPFACNGSKCFVACSADTQCVSPNRCQTSSCGQSNNGASCSIGSQCKSGICAQGYCCDKACNGACQSCALAGTLGACTNVATGTADPSGMCKDMGAASCGTNGRCQAGACQKYASGTSCAPATCPAGTTTFTAGSTCDGNGTCVKPAARSCAPYLCGNAACFTTCTANTQCASPAVCTNASCGLKNPGTVCADGAECKSGFCRHGVCCATECNSTCKSCNASAATAGTCTNVAAGRSDPAGICKDMGATSCGTNGVCDGNGACQRYAAGTTCAAASCPSGTSTQTNARTCDGAGACRAATTIACAPYRCNAAAAACNSACRSDADCVAPTICDPKTSLCGNLVRQGGACTATAECLSGLTCVDRICCGSTSCPMCQACNVSGSLGTCANVAAGTTDPRGMCAPSASAPCGNTGACNGAGACAKASTTTVCAAATCSGSTAKTEAHCNGSGACGEAVSINCSPYVCGGNACRSSCTTNADCLAPFTCQGSGSTKNCALKANGAACGAGGECISGNCVDTVCCGSAACPACQACNLNGAGSCAPMAAGTTDTTCAAGNTPCGKTNTCDGAGECRNSTATCAAATCNGTSFTPASVCSGSATTCPIQAPMSCGLYTCTTSGCKTSCANDGDCAPGSYCGAGNHCISAGAIGDACSADNQCAAGRCVDGVCCGISAATCPLCQACNLNGARGTCTFVGTGNAEPHNLCPVSDVCGNTGACGANQTCAKAPQSTMCGVASCSAGTETRATFCDGAGGCTPPVVRACDPYVCSVDACATVCVADTDCIPGDYCAADGSCQPKLAPGATCSSTSQCASGVCGAENVCCDGECMGSCVSCKLATSPGTCRPLTTGTACGATSCSDDNRYFSGYACDGAGACMFVDPSNPVDCAATGLMCSTTQMCQ